MYHLSKFKVLSLNILIFSSAIFLLTCSKSVEPIEENNEPPPAPVIDQGPINNSSNQSVNSVLQWMCIDPDNDPLSYDVYFGTDAAPGLVASNQSQNSYTPNNLLYNTKYYWKIVAKDDHSHSISSAIWNFTTEPEAPSLSVSLSNLDFGTSTPSLTFDISNSGADTLTWTISKNKTWLTVAPFNGTTTDETDQIVVTVNRAGLLDGDYTGRITILSNGGNAVVDVAMSVISVQTNDPPVVTDIPNQTISEGAIFATIPLDNFVSDPDNSDTEMTWSYSGNNQLNVNITNRIATISIPDINWNGSESITFRATDPGALWDEDVATFTVSSNNDPPTVSGIPDQTITEGSTFTTINLDDYVFDIDNIDNQMTWTYAGNTELSVNIVNRVATITIPDVNWNGSETIIFRATDPGALWDEDTASFTVTAVNDPPVVSDIPDQTIAEGQSFATISLDNYVNDVDNSDAELFWTITGNSELSISISKRVVTIQIPSPTWNGGETITFRATDTGSLYDEDAATFIVSANNDPPVVTDIPGQTITEGTSFATINLDDYVDDLDHADNEMIWTYSGNTDLTVAITARVATITAPDINWNGSESITFRATDPGSLFDEDAATFTINPVNDLPTLVDSVTSVSVSPVDRIGANTTDISATFTDVDEPAVSEFYVIFRIREPNNSTVLTLVDSLQDGNGGLTVNNNGSGSYTASYTYDPIDAQTLGLYDLYFEVTDGSTPVIDDYANNLDELEITETNNSPTVATGATSVSPSQVTRTGIDSTVISTVFTDIDQPGVDAFTVTFKALPETGSDETLVNAQTNGNGGLIITDLTGGDYKAEFTWDPASNQKLGFYDLYFEVSDGTNTAVDSYDNNLDELEVIDNQAPTVIDIPAQSISEGSSFTSITLDSFVSDPDNTDDEMTWTYSGNTELTVDITARVATITAPDIDWNGAELLTFRATDPGALFDEDTATFTVTAVNDAPVVGDILDQTINDGESFTTITLDDFVTDVDNTDAEITWTYSGNTELIVDITNRIATITAPSVEWNGAETITFKAEDLEPLADSNEALFTVNIENDPPVVTDIPAQSITEGSSFTTITLDDFVSDLDNTEAEMTWTFSGNTNLSVDITDRIATITPPDTNWNGTETLTFRATDPGALFDEDTASFTVTGVNDAPVVGDIPDQTIDEGNSFTTITLDDFVTDVDNTDAEITWTFSGNTELSVDITDRVATITTPDADWNGAETITFKAEDLQPLADSNNAIFTVNPQNDAPTLVDSVTAVSVSPVTAVGANTTVISATFTDVDEPAVTVFNVTIKIREPDNLTELILVNNLQHDSGGLTIIDNGGGSYTASFTYDPGDAQTTGLYDLYFEVTDGSTPAVDAYDNNLDELEIN